MKQKKSQIKIFVRLKEMAYRCLGFGDFRVATLKRPDQKTERIGLWSQLMMCRSECAICWSCKLQKRIRLPCLHIFHASCLDQWIETGADTCPVCRKCFGGTVNPQQTEESRTLLERDQDKYPFTSGVEVSRFGADTIHLPFIFDDGFPIKNIELFMAVIEALRMTGSSSVFHGPLQRADVNNAFYPFGGRGWCVIVTKDTLVTDTNEGRFENSSLQLVPRDPSFSGEKFLLKF